MWKLCAPMAISLFLAAGAAGAASLYDEATQPDLSTDSSVYTVISLLPGQNTITLTTGDAASDLADYFELDLKGLTLERIDLVSIDLGPNNTNGTRFSSCLGPGDDCLPFNGIAETLMVGSTVGMDLLAILEQQAPGQLTNFFRVGESTGPATTVLSIVATPEPGTALLVGSGLLALGRLSRGPRRAA